ncbi:TPA: suppressor of fused domain protein, partial [Neisseria meningitidis]
AEYLIDNRQPILRGEIIQLPRVIIEGSKMDALYVSAPFYFDDDFQVCYGEHYNIVFPLLVPLYKQEAEWVEKKGWNAFEQFLLDNEVGNLSDMNRKPFTW